jgi:hypothetical protein
MRITDGHWLLDWRLENGMENEHIAMSENYHLN